MKTDQEEPGCAMAVMVNPVAAVDGQVYDRENIICVIDDEKSANPSWDLPHCVQE